MISKLESAGLGFYVRMNETLDKLGQLCSVLCNSDKSKKMSPSVSMEEMYPRLYQQSLCSSGGLECIQYHSQVPALIFTSAVIACSHPNERRSGSVAIHFVCKRKV